MADEIKLKKADTTTGTGGFPIDGKVNTYDVGVDSSEKSKEPYTSGGVAVDASPRDISVGTKKTLGEYLRDTTLGKTPSSGAPIKNSYPIAHGAGEKVREVALLDAAGYVPPLEITSKEQPHFADIVPGDSRALPTTGILRGREKPAPESLHVDGNGLLSGKILDGGTLDEALPVAIYTATVLKDPSGKGLTVDKIFSPTLYYKMPRPPVPTTDEGRGYHLHLVTHGMTPTSPTSVSNTFPIENQATVKPQILKLNEDGYVPPLTVIPLTQTHFSDISTGRSTDSITLNILRGRQKPDGKNLFDGNYLLKFAAADLPAAPVPPPPGTVNVTGLEIMSPIGDYTETVLAKNGMGPNNPFSLSNFDNHRAPGDVLTKPVNSTFIVAREDFSEQKKKSLSDYLGKLTREGPGPLGGNTYPVYTNSVISASLLDEKQLPNGPGPSPSSRTNYVEDGVLSSRSTAATRLNIARGRSRATDPTTDGHWLLRNATSEIINGGPLNPSADGGKLPELKSAELVSKEIKDYYGDPKNLSNSLIYNRFNSSSTFEDETSGNASKRLATKHFAKKYPMGKSLGPDDPSRDMTYGRLAQIGNALMLRATRELGAFDNGNPTGGKAEANALLPGSAQLGLVKSKPSELTAESVIDVLTTTDLNKDLLIDPAGFSWGSLNNPLDQFAGISNFGMQLLSVALLIAFGLTVTGMSVLFSFDKNTAKRNRNIVNADDFDNRKPLGSSTRYGRRSGTNSIGSMVSEILSGEFDFWNAIGVAPTLNPKNKCVPVGALSFFGIGQNDVQKATYGNMVAIAATKGLLASVQSPGFYSIMARSVNRSLVAIASSTAEMIKSFAHVGTNPVAAVKQLFGMLDILKESKLMKFMNIFAQLGDRVLQEVLVENGKDLQSYSDSDPRRHPSRLDIALTETSIRRNRLPGNSIRLAWSTFRAPDLLLMSKTYAGARNASINKTDARFTAPSMLPSINNKGDDELRTNGIYDMASEGRIDTATREKMEDFLEAEYVPFYIHDVRTNEIVSFHAFLASLSDGYTAAYDTSEGFGRVDAIKIYKNTHRKIDFSFYIAATSPEDFDAMWIKINKLTTLVYPQFSEGRSLYFKESGDVLHAPFSQTIQASPLVRVRIGDLIKSNYSKFGLARLFGYGHPGTILSGSSIDVSTQILKEFNSSTYVPQEGDTYTLSPNIDLGVLWTGNATFSNAMGSQFRSLPESHVAKVTKSYFDPKSNKNVCVLEIIEASGEDIPTKYKNDSAAFKKDVDIGKRILTYFTQTIALENKIELFQDYLIPTPTTVKKIYPKLQNNAVTSATANDKTNTSKYVNSFIDLMNDESTDGSKGNAVVRSFRSTGGKGLAGFIDSMNFDWYDRTTWEIGNGTKDNNVVGRRAPKMCKVTISFSPIHDITPGLDSAGMNRAPIYPVGPMWTNDVRNTSKDNAGSGTPEKTGGGK